METKTAYPHYILVSTLAGPDQPGRWRFVLRAVDGSYHLIAEDIEEGVQPERLHLLAIVRGLEALDQPSRVTVVTPSRYVREGIQYGLDEWRRNGWRWEYFGQMVPVKNSDLWQRVDAALRYHHVECRNWRFDPPHIRTAGPVRSGPWHCSDSALGPAEKAVCEPSPGCKPDPPGRARVGRGWVRRLMGVIRALVLIRARLAPTLRTG